MKVGEVFRPQDQEQAAEAVAAALAADAPLEIAGAGSHAALGRPVASAARLETAGLAGVSMYEPEELVFTAGAGTPLAEVRRMLAERGQMLAFEPPDFSALLGASASGGTLGGMVARGLAGPRRIRAGSVRDHLLGLAAVNGRAEAFKAGGRVMKNVTGFDLPKLMCGAFGTLAVLTELTFKLQPAPRAAATLRLRGLGEDAANAAMTRALGLPLEVSGAAHLPADVTGGEAATLLRLEGFEASVKARMEMLQEALKEHPGEVLEGERSESLWRDVRDVRPLAGDEESLIWRICCPPAQGAQVARALREMIPSARLFMDWGGGLIWLSVPPSPHAGAGLVRGALGEVGGHATLFRAPEGVRRNVAVFQPQPEALAEVTARIKAAFDPRDILNPGRVYPSAREREA